MSSSARTLLDQRALAAAIDEALLLTAWERPSAIGDQTGPGPIGMSVSHAWIVYGAWALIAVVVKVLVADRRDV
jgi:hypothetical protein